MAKAALPQVSPAPTIGSLIDKMKTIAVERSVLSAKDKALSEEQKSLEQQIIELKAQATLEDVLEFLKDEKLRPFVLDIETDSTVSPDERQEKASPMEIRGKALRIA